MRQRPYLYFSFVIVCTLLLHPGHSQAQSKTVKQSRNIKPTVEGTPPKAKEVHPQKDSISPVNKEDSHAPATMFSEHIVEVLRTTANEAAGWDNSASAAKTQAQVADLTWEFAPPIARSYLEQAWDLAGKIIDKTPSTPAPRYISTKTETQRTILLIARKRDQTLADKWLELLTKQSRETQEDKVKKSGQNTPRGAFDDRTARSSILLGMAINIIADQPQVAAELAIASLEDGISFELQPVLLALQNHSFDLAQAVLQKALARVRQIGITDPNELLILHSYLFTPGLIKVASTGDKPGNIQIAVGRNQQQITAAAKLKPELVKEFLYTAADALLRLPLPSNTVNPQSAARMQYEVLQTIASGISSSAPERASALRSRAQAIVQDAQFSTAPPAVQPLIPPVHSNDSQIEQDERRVVRLEELAKQETNPLSRDIAFAKAALATQAASYERGWSLADQISDKRFRVGVANWLTYRASLHFIQQKDFAKARLDLISKNEDLIQRSATLVIGAQKLIETKDQIQAHEWLQEANNLLGNDAKEESALAISLGIVSAYGKFDHLRALDALTNSIKLLNQWPDTLSLTEKAPLPKRFAGLPVADFTYGTKGFGITSVATTFTIEEFDTVLALLQDLKHQDIKGQFIIELCQHHLKISQQKKK